jgi:hypothetical protein
MGWSFVLLRLVEYSLLCLNVHLGFTDFVWCYYIWHVAIDLVSLDQILMYTLNVLICM